MTATPSPLATRLATNDELDEVVAVCASALGWSMPEFDRELFEWKHFDNAFGKSLLLVAADDSADPGKRIKAVRPFMRWRFAHAAGPGLASEVITAARAVDTATLPEAQGRGLFRQLTLAGLDHLAEENCGFVFNTPNDKSLPGYLKMGWTEAGAVRLGFGVSSPKVARKLSRSRTAATKPSLPTPDLGISIEDALSLLDPATLTAPTTRLTTEHTIETLRWRYATGPITYRFLRATPTGGVVVRLRQRGEVRELVVAQVLGDVPARDIARHVRNAMDAVKADLCVSPPGLGKTVAVTALGPTLALRRLHHDVAGADFAWSPGDIELF